MIGHTKATAGLAGLVKAALALHHASCRRTAASIDRCPSSRAPDSRLYLVDEAKPWVAPVRIAAPCRGQLVRLRRHQLPRRDGGIPRRVPRLAAARDDRALAGRAAACGAMPTGRRSSPACSKLRASLPQPRRRRAARPRREPRASGWTAGAETIAIVAKDHADLLAKLGLALKWLETPGQGAAARRVPRRTRAARLARSLFCFPARARSTPTCCAQWQRISPSAEKPCRKPTRCCATRSTCASAPVSG